MGLLMHHIHKIEPVPLFAVRDELKVVEVGVVGGRDLDVVEVPRDLAVLALDGALELELGPLLLSPALEALGELAGLG